MITVADIHNITFEKSVRGYRPEDVDAFLTQIAQEIDTLTRTCEEARQEKEAALANVRREKEDAEKKIYILAEKIEEYRKDEDNLKIALLNAQRLGESVVNEAKQKAETIVNDARGRAQQAEQQMKEAVYTEEKRLAHMQAEVARFKTGILGLYKQHIDALSLLPVPEDHKAEPIAKSGAAMQHAVAPVQAAPAKHVPAATPDLIVVAENAPESHMAAPQEILAPQREPAAAAENDFVVGQQFAPEADGFENYQGISFDE